ncbi:hypothetical protein [Vagococcus humatus]|uniref:Uncharacterized protein n=1 Tax=Vagococcus humatus TaxID=1889241 RepID=A0A429Z9C5_9ENTE|nr:hypothetical protein [Vagococcus humatus]RST90266.1 hypothetical protein C7P63_04110 [Vagococcus humatus]
MHQALVMIIMDEILSQFESETVFCENYLTIPLADWNRWKAGLKPLDSEKMQKLKALFSDYEWMLIQKIIRQTILFPEKRHIVVSEYRRVKTLIANKWIQTGSAEVELITQKNSRSQYCYGKLAQGTITLKVSLEYEGWGYDDILEFRLPAVVQKQIEDAPIDLLEWVNENLTDTYVAKEAVEEDGEA